VIVIEGSALDWTQFGLGGAAIAALFYFANRTLLMLTKMDERSAEREKRSAEVHKSERDEWRAEESRRTERLARALDELTAALRK
jgi:hypothetical protein